MLQSNGVPVRHLAGDRANYNLNRDEIFLPEQGKFSSAHHYYQTALHELRHSTGHPDRVIRAPLVEGVGEGFGSEAYAKEELRAEIRAMMTSERWTWAMTRDVGNRPYGGRRHPARRQPPGRNEAEA